MIPSTLALNGFVNTKKYWFRQTKFYRSSLAYNWNPKRNNTARFDFFNMQYVRNLNPENYFNVYESSYNALNDISQNLQYNTDFM